MAAEYSRELSVKVFSSLCRLIELGFRQGGAPGYGLRSQLIAIRRRKAAWPRRAEELADGPGHPGPGSQNEIEVGQKIYTRFVSDKQTEREIAEQLNGAGILGEHGRPWTRTPSIRC